MSRIIRPVSSAFVVPEMPEFDVIKAGLARIDSVHEDGLLSPLTVARGPALTRGTSGYLDLNSATLYVYDEAGESELARAVFYHEVGHVLDLFGLPPAGHFASSAGASLLSEWTTAVAASERVRRLESALQTESERNSSFAMRNRYVLRLTELWARSYCQYVALKSGDVEVGRRLDLINIKLAGGSVVRSHWDRTDFESILNAIDALFWEMQWSP